MPQLKNTIYLFITVKTHKSGNLLKPKDNLIITSSLCTIVIELYEHLNKTIN